MSRAASKLFKDDALGRLKMINILHDFKNIDRAIEKMTKGTEDEKEDIDSTVWNAFFPKLLMNFSQNENPLGI
jgi:hypothetical protein